MKLMARNCKTFFASIYIDNRYICYHNNLLLDIYRYSIYNRDNDISNIYIKE